jgi:hypothetical protein
MNHIVWIAVPVVVGRVRSRTDASVDTKNVVGEYTRIRCPRCRWQPDRHSLDELMEIGRVYVWCGSGVKDAGIQDLTAI